MSDTRYIIRWRGKRWGEILAASQAEAIERFLAAFPEPQRAQFGDDLTAEAAR